MFHASISQISQFLHTVPTASTRRIGSICVHFRGFAWIREIFRSKSTNFGARCKVGAQCKVLPVRDQKRSGRENHLTLESTTETCSKHDFSMIFVGYSSTIFCDFDGFPQISQFLHTVLTASRERIGSTCVHFRGFGWIRAIFGSKSTKFRRLGQSVTGK